MTDVALDAAVGALEKLGFARESHEHVDYFRELASMPLERLEQQPAQQRMAAANIQHQLTELCLRETSTFVEAYGAVRALPSTKSKLEESLTLLQDEILPGIIAAAEHFETAGKDAIERRAAQMELDEEYNASLREFVGTPRSIRSCIEREAYDEALQIARRFGPMHESWAQKDVGDAVARRVAEELERMRRDLVRSFKEPKLQMPRARRVMGLLDALGQLQGSAGSRPDACATFLKARHELAMRTLRGKGPLGGVLDAWKDIVLGAVTIAIAEFDEPAVLELVATFSDVAQAALRQYVSARCAALVPDEHCTVRELEGAVQEIAAVHTQLCYIGPRFSDCGLCFDGAMHADKATGIFEDVALRLWNVGLQRMVTLSGHEKFIGGRASDAGNEPDMFHAPSLHAFPALSACVNGLVAALNVLRQFAPLRIRVAAVQALGAHLDVIATRINAVQRSARPGERGAYERAGGVFSNILVPWSARALVQGVYGGSGDAMAVLRAQAPRFMSHVDKLAARDARDSVN